MTSLVPKLAKINVVLYLTLNRNLFE